LWSPADLKLSAVRHKRRRCENILRRIACPAASLEEVAIRNRYGMNDIFARIWENLNARLTGPMNLRFILQPTIAMIFAIRAGLRDAHQNRPAFLWAVLWNPAYRRELLRQGWKDVGKVLLLATILDVIYQLIIHRGVYILELLITAVALAVIPYVLFRGPISRIARMVFAARLARKQPSIQ
jgi:hypothetical protein